MNSKTLLFLAALVLIPGMGSAQTWLSNPGSNVWNLGTNWDTDPVYPQTASDTATFGSSSVTNINIIANISLDGIVFNGSAPSYTIDTGGFNMLISGAGFANSSSASQTLNNSGSGFVIFYNNSTIDDLHVVNAGTLFFDDNSTADNAAITSTGSLAFYGNSTAGNSTLGSNGSLSFVTTASAGTADITANVYTAFNNNSTAASASIMNTGFMGFYDDTTAASAAISNPGSTYFYNNATAGNSNISNDNILNFENTSTAGAATITNDNGGTLRFLHTSTGGTARIILNGTGGLDVGGHTGPLTLGSLEGAGYSYIGATPLAVGANNLSILYAGVIDDGAFSSSFTKVGSGAMTLSALNTYDGGTTIAAGSLVLGTGGRLGTGVIQNNAALLFINAATSDGLTLTNGAGAVMGYENSATAGSAVITNAATGYLYFNSTASADDAAIQNGGTVTFSGNSTAGASSITTSGSLVFTNNSALGSSTLTTSSGGNTSLLMSTTGDSARIIANSGGTFDISSHTGGVTVGSAAGAGNFTLGANSLSFGLNNLSTTISGVISGTGAALNKLGSGTLSLTGANTYTGGTFAIGGLAINSDSSLGDTVANANVTLSTGTLRTLAGVTSSRNIILASGTYGAFDSNGFNSTMNGIVSGSGSFNKTGAGTLTLGGANTYSGGTTLGGGTLAVGNSSSLGTGTVVVTGGTLTTSGGPLAVNVAGDYTQTSGGSLSLGVTGTLAGQWDNLNVVGVATLGGTLNITSYGSFVPQGGDTLILLSAGNGLTGRFDQWTSPAGTRWYLIYQPYSVLLQAIHPSFKALGLTPNQKAVGTWLDNVYQDPKLQTLMLTIGTQPAASMPPDYDLIAPEDLTPIYRIGYAAAQNRALLVERRLAEIRTTDGNGPSASRFRSFDQEGPLFAADLPGDQMRALARGAEPEDRWGVFVTGAGNFATIADDGNAAGYRFTATGMTAGMDYRFSKTITGGLLLGYSQAGATNGSAGKVDVTGGQVGLYGGIGAGGFHTEALAEFGLNSYKTTRAAFGGAATGTASGTQLSGALSLGYDFKMGLLRWGPFAGGQYTLVQLDAFTESGSQVPLSFPSQNQGSLRGQAGLRFSPTWKGKDMTFTPHLSGAYERYFEGTQDSLTAGLSSTTGTFTTLGPLTGDGAVAVVAGLDVEFASGLTAFAQYQGKFALTNYDSQGFSGGVNIGF